VERTSASGAFVAKSDALADDDLDFSRAMPTVHSEALSSVRYERRAFSAESPLIA
jgi:hypothetical protein